MRIEKETIWLNLNQMAELFQRDKSVISRHLRNVYKEGELDRKATVAKNATVQIAGTLCDPDGGRLISDAALVATTLMIAESRPEEKDVLVRIVMHLLCDRTQP